MNEKYIKALSEFTNIVQQNKYIIMGSVALLSYTQSQGYDREIHDIDIIMDTDEAVAVAHHLKSLGYKQTTFINPRMPFYSKLLKYAENKYLRFSKDGVDIEILSTKFEFLGELFTFEMYPAIKAAIPKDVLATSNYSDIEFSTVSKEALYFFKKVADNTEGRKVKYKQNQRYNDIAKLEKLIDQKKYSNVKNDSRLTLFGISTKIPKLLLK